MFRFKPVDFRNERGYKLRRDEAKEALLFGPHEIKVHTTPASLDPDALFRLEVFIWHLLPSSQRDILGTVEAFCEHNASNDGELLR